jgi:hypothetical protein
MIFSFLFSLWDDFAQRIDRLGSRAQRKLSSPEILEFSKSKFHNERRSSRMSAFVHAIAIAR